MSSLYSGESMVSGAGPGIGPAQEGLGGRVFPDRGQAAWKRQGSSAVRAGGASPLGGLGSACEALSVHSEVGDIEKELVRWVSELLGAGRVSVMRWDARSGSLRIRASRGLDRRVARRVRVALGEGVSGWVARERRAVLVADLEEDERFIGCGWRGYRSQSFMSVPLSMGGSLLGVVNITEPDGRELFGQGDVDIAGILAHQAAAGIGCAKAEQRERDLAGSMDAYRDHFKAVIQSCPIGIIVTDHDGRINLCNDAQVDLSGKSMMDTLGRQLFAPGGYAGRSPEARCLLTSVLESGASGSETRIRYERGDGCVQVLDVRIEALKVRDEIIGAVVATADVTIQDELAQCVRRSERLATVGQLAAGIAHEIANPLAVVYGNLQLWEEGCGGGGIKEEEIALVRRELSRCIGVTKRLRDLSRPRTDCKGMVDVNELLRDALLLMQAEFRYRNIAVDASLDEDLPWITGDRDRLQELFMNLMLNGVQAMSGGGKLGVSSRTNSSGDVVIAVSDTGHGIAPELMRDIFTPFFTTRRDEGGTGLGLMVARQVAEEHRGRIDVESRPSCGTVFTVTCQVNPVNGVNRVDGVNRGRCGSDKEEVVRGDRG